MAKVVNMRFNQLLRGPILVAELDQHAKLVGQQKGLAELEGKAEELRALARQDKGANVEDEASQLDDKAAAMLADLYAKLDPWQKCQVARHPGRPHALDYVEALFTVGGDQVDPLHRAGSVGIEGSDVDAGRQGRRIGPYRVGAGG